MAGQPQLDGASDADPIRWFHSEFVRAQQSEAFDPARAALATVDESGNPSVRYVLVKDVSDAGFLFYTNLRSPKARHLRGTPRAALAYHWHSLSLQVRVAGAIEAVEADIADAYFSTRPRESQLGAWASDQSDPIANGAALHEKLAEVERRFEGGDVPRPGHWSGLRIVATSIEFWLSHTGRMHDRWLFERGEDGGDWQRTRLQP